MKILQWMNRKLNRKVETFSDVGTKLEASFNLDSLLTIGTLSDNNNCYYEEQDEHMYGGDFNYIGDEFNYHRYLMDVAQPMKKNTAPISIQLEEEEEEGKKKSHVINEEKVNENVSLHKTEESLLCRLSCKTLHLHFHARVKKSNPPSTKDINANINHEECRIKYPLHKSMLSKLLRWLPKAKKSKVCPAPSDNNISHGIVKSSHDARNLNHLNYLNQFHHACRSSYEVGLKANNNGDEDELEEGKLMNVKDDHYEIQIQHNDYCVHIDEEFVVFQF